MRGPAGCTTIARWGGAQRLRTLVVLVLLLSLRPGEGAANERYAALVRDVTSGEVLFARSPHERRYPASLTKMMTLFVLFEDLKQRRVALDTPLFVTPQAEAQPALKLGLAAGETITVEQAIKASITQSSNDVAVVIAEALEGSEEAFAARMTRTAHTLGMEDTQFRNASGLPDPDQHTTAWDMAMLGVALQIRFPEYYPYFKTTSFEFRGRTYSGHNRVLQEVEGADGVKTGYIRASGFNLVSSVQREGRKVIAVVMGGRTAQTRDAHMVELIDRYLLKAEAGSGYAHDIRAAVDEPSGAPREYTIQVGRTATARAALEVLRQLQEEHQDLLGGRTPVVDRDGEQALARFAGFDNREEAQDACRQLRHKDLICRIGQL